MASKGSLDIARTQVGGEAIDLGGFRQFVHRRALDKRVTWGVEIHADPGYPDSSFGLNLDSLVVLASFGLALDDKNHPLARSRPSLDSYQLMLDGENCFRMSRRSDGQLHVDELTPKFAKTLQGLYRYGNFSLVEPEDWSEAQLEQAILGMVAESRGLFPNVTRVDSDLKGIVDTLRNVLARVRSAVERELERFSYLGPLRSYPPRHMAFAVQDDTNWVAGGGRAWDQMRRSKKLRDEVNTWLGSKERLQTPYNIALQRYIAPITAHGAIGAGIDEILSKLNERDETAEDEDAPTEASPLDRDALIKLMTEKLLHNHDVEGDEDLVLVDMRTDTTVSHRDVGIGISQVLPVLVEAYGNKDRLVAIEQPEIHLHPRLQAELGDVFIESALGERKNTFLLETHSEHLILRVLRRIRETAQGRLPAGLSPVRPENVAVLFVVPDDGGSRIVEIPISAEGEFTRPWPGGFFAERMKELY